MPARMTRSMTPEMNQQPRSDSRLRRGSLRCSVLAALCVAGLGSCAEPVTESLAQSPEDSSSVAAPSAVPTDGVAPVASESDGAELRAPLFKADVEGPGIRAIEGTRDFGEVYSGTVLDHTFRIEAIGTEPLVISRIKPSCGCTVATTEVIEADGTRRAFVLHEPLPVGTQLEVSCTFDTAGKRGPQVKPINVYCNDPRGVERLILKADLEEFLTASPTTLQLGRFSIIESRSTKFMVRSTSGEPVKLSVDPLRIPAELAVEFEAEEPDANGRSNTWKVEVTLGGSTLAAGPYQFLLPIDSDSPNPNAPADARPDQRWLGGSVLVTADILDVYTYSPRQLVFGAVSPDTSVSRGLAFHSFDEDYPLESLDIEVVGENGAPLANRELYHTRVEPGNADGTWRVELMIDGLPADAGKFVGQLRIATKNPNRPTIDIPFVGVVR